MRLRVPAILVVLALTLALPPAQAFAQSSLFFSDALTGPSSPNLTIPFNKYGYSPAGLTRIQDDAPGTDYATDRPMVLTSSGAYLTATAFIAEITVNVLPDDIVYFGFGQGTRNPDYVGEPSNGFLFRIHNWHGYTGIQVAAEATGLPGGPFLDDRTIGNYTPGSLTMFRIARSGDNLILSVPSSGATWTYSVSQYAGTMGLTDANTFLFFGNSHVTGTVFSNLNVTLPPPSLPTTTAQCKDGGWRSYGVFANQGDCVSYVATKGKNAPGN
jgi:hypothetical protein